MTTAKAVKLGRDYNLITAGTQYPLESAEAIQRLSQAHSSGKISEKEYRKLLSVYLGRNLKSQFQNMVKLVFSPQVYLANSRN
jgi:hypothetical protein